jgi:MFS family permease
LKEPRYSLLALLAFLNVLNFLDRQLLPAIGPRLVAEQRLTRTQLGLLVGFSFVAFFAVASLALGFFADRVSRTRLTALGVATWSAMTIATGAAQGFGQLALARLFIGLGEAALVPCALSLLADLFPARHLGLASGLFWAGWPVGRALSFFVAGTLVPAIGWRSCFTLLGAVGLPAAGLMLLFREPPRPKAAPGSAAAAWRELRQAVADEPGLLWVTVGNVLLAVAAGAAALEVTWLVAERGMSPAQAALLSGVVVAAASLLGNPLVGALADRWERVRPGGRALCLAVLAATCMPPAIVFYRLAPDSVFFIPCWFLAQVAMGGWQGTSSAVVQQLAPPRIRALAVSLVLLLVNLLGIGPGSWLAGALGDARSLSAGLVAASAIGLLAVVPYALAARFSAGRQLGQRYTGTSGGE